MKPREIKRKLFMAVTNIAWIIQALNFFGDVLLKPTEVQSVHQQTSVCTPTDFRFHTDPTVGCIHNHG